MASETAKPKGSPKDEGKKDGLNLFEGLFTEADMTTMTKLITDIEKLTPDELSNLWNLKLRYLMGSHAEEIKSIRNALSKSLTDVAQDISSIRADIDYMNSQINTKQDKDSPNTGTEQGTKGDAPKDKQMMKELSEVQAKYEELQNKYVNLEQIVKKTSASKPASGNSPTGKPVAQSESADTGEKKDVKELIHEALTKNPEKNGMIEWPTSESGVNMLHVLPDAADKRFNSIVKQGLIDEKSQNKSKNKEIFRGVQEIAKEFRLSGLLTIKLLQRATSGSLHELISNMLTDCLEYQKIWIKVQEYATKPVTPSEAEARLQTRIFSPEGTLGENILAIYNDSCSSVTETDPTRRSKIISEKAKSSLSLLLTFCVAERDIKAITADVAVHLHTMKNADEFTYWDYTNKVLLHLKSERILSKKGQTPYVRNVAGASAVPGHGGNQNYNSDNNNNSNTNNWGRSERRNGRGGGNRYQNNRNSSNHDQQHQNQQAPPQYQGGYNGPPQVGSGPRPDLQFYPPPQGPMYYNRSGTIEPTYYRQTTGPTYAPPPYDGSWNNASQPGNNNRGDGPRGRNNPNWQDQQGSQDMRSRQQMRKGCYMCSARDHNSRQCTIFPPGTGYNLDDTCTNRECKGFQGHHRGSHVFAN